ncbi:MAG: hypothetical protein Q7W30_05535 [Coriobacteriia bacterium]|nr:hypothetical protein [Coriobacteriia bacterium]
MTIDGCPYDFATLAADVLPARMRELRAHMLSPVSMSEFAVPGHGPKTIARRHGFDGDVSGCYVFMDGGAPIYVGISRHVFERLAQHVGRGDHLTATLAYRMAAHDAPHGRWAATAMADPTFRAVFDSRRAYLAGLDVAVVEIPNPLELYLFEAYAAMELETSHWNTFATH